MFCYFNGFIHFLFGTFSTQYKIFLRSLRSVFIFFYILLCIFLDILMVYFSQQCSLVLYSCPHILYFISNYLLKVDENDKESGSGWEWVRVEGSGRKWVKVGEIW